MGYASIARLYCAASYPQDIHRVNMFHRYKLCILRNVEHTCSKCGAAHSRYRNRYKSKPASYCKACHAKNMRMTRPKHSQLSPEAKAKANCRAMANVYQNRGKLSKMPCENCGDTAEKHHDDYTKPLLVRWLCRPCHLLEHSKTQNT